MVASVANELTRMDRSLVVERTSLHQTKISNSKVERTHYGTSAMDPGRGSETKVTRFVASRMMDLRYIAWSVLRSIHLGMVMVMVSQRWSQASGRQININVSGEIVSEMCAVYAPFILRTRLRFHPARALLFPISLDCMGRSYTPNPDRWRLLDAGEVSDRR